MAFIAVSEKFVWNLVFTIPFCTGILMVFLSALGMARTMGHGHGAHLGHGAGHPHTGVVGAHGTGHAAAGHGHAAARGAGVRGGGGHRGAGRLGHARGAGRGGVGKAYRSGSSLTDALALVGVGKVPFPIIMQTLLVSWGLIGVEAQKVLAKLPLTPGVRLLPSMGIALVGSLLTTRLAAEVLGRITPEPEESYALEAEDLVGTAGEVVYRVTETTGSLHVYDGTGALHELRARCRPGHPALEKGGKAIVVEYDPANRWYWVERWQGGASNAP